MNAAQPAEETKRQESQHQQQQQQQQPCQVIFPLASLPCFAEAAAWPLLSRARHIHFRRVAIHYHYEERFGLISKESVTCCAYFPTGRNYTTTEPPGRGFCLFLYSIKICNQHNKLQTNSTAQGYSLCISNKWHRIIVLLFFQAVVMMVVKVVSNLTTTTTTTTTCTD